MDAIIRRAKKEDLAELREFLSRAGLGTEGISEETMAYFLLLEDGDKAWRGTLGIEPYQKNGLLRSLVISPEQANHELLLLFEQALALAKERNMEQLFLATNKNTAVSFFNILGFQPIEKKELPEEISRSRHVKHIFNVDNSLFLKLVL